MRSRLFRVAVWAGCLSVGVAYASDISFTGTFSSDDQLETFLFTAPSASFTAETWSYAGGTNANFQFIPSGGFDPVLSLFNATGGLVAGSVWVGTNNDGAGVATDLSTSYAFDSLLAISTLQLGDTYALVLSEYDNLPYGTTYGDGFTRTGNGDFTPGVMGCGGTAPFCDEGLDQRDGNWAVDIDGVGSAEDITGGGSAPEPGTVLMLSAGLASLAMIRRRRQRCHRDTGL